MRKIAISQGIQNSKNYSIKKDMKYKKSGKEKKWWNKLNYYFWCQKLSFGIVQKLF
jgi:hypothetical protein